MTINYNIKQQAYWNNTLENLQSSLQTSIDNGLTFTESEKRLSMEGKNTIRPKRKSNLFSLFFSQFKSPIIIIFIITSLLSFFLGQVEDAVIIFIIIIISSIIGFWQEKRALNAIDKLLEMVNSKITVIRNAQVIQITSELIVPGDVIILKSGDSIPSDCIIIESQDLFVNEASLTGESYPTEKSPKVLQKDVPLKERSNCVFMGTFVISGTARVLAVQTGTNTELGRISKRLKDKIPETEFEHGVRKFGYFLMEITLLLVISILIINVYFGRSALDSFLFSLALAIGLTPQLLPAIIGVNLSHGAQRMAKEKVIVKRLDAIENLGSMNILCSDKTGTLTIGDVKLKYTLNVEGEPNKNKVLLYAYLNSAFETGFVNPVDKAIKDYCFGNFDISQYNKIGEIPYDFIRKRLTIAVSCTKKISFETVQDLMHFFIITKGALNNILEICNYVETSKGEIVDLLTYKSNILQTYEKLGKEGFRVLGLCYKNIPMNNISSNKIAQISKNDEIQMIFLGFIVFFDPIKPGIVESMAVLRKMGVLVKIISGDNRHVVSSIAYELGISNKKVLSGQELHKISPEALIAKANEMDIFAEIEPNQKEQIILALRKSQNNVVGYMGDGINDASALHASDVGISVNNAPNVVKEASDFVLLEKDLTVLADGIKEGRKTFANTLKYVFMATSANFGNMFSMAGASLFLPFLPLLPKQILFMNLLTDIPEMTISTDNVDIETVEKPRRWDIKFIRKFMMVFGLLSALFDYITFGLLLYVLNPNTVEQFRTIWFLESIVSACTIVFVIRTKKPLFKSKPRIYLGLSIIGIICFVITLPYVPIGKIFGLSAISYLYLGMIGIIVLFYVISAEIIKKMFYKTIKL